jgi:hypothetical protein
MCREFAARSDSPAAPATGRSVAPADRPRITTAGDGGSGGHDSGEEPEADEAAHGCGYAPRIAFTMRPATIRANRTSSSFGIGVRAETKRRPA